MPTEFVDPALERLGWTSYFQEQFVALAAVAPTGSLERVVVEWRGEYGVLGAEGARRCVLSGRLARDLGDEQRPCVGDFVMATFEPSSELGRIEHVFERRGVFRRKAAGNTAKSQSIAANIDIGFIVSALAPEASDERVVERSLNPRRIERYLRAIREANARAVVVVTKADLRPNAAADALALEEVLGAPDLLLVSARTGLGMDQLTERLGPGVTGVLVGSSGVGKSSLTNRLLGRDAQSVEAIREVDARGRHTTTHRELFVLPSGGLLIDTPGMREFGLFADETTDSDDAGFDEITKVGEDCRFRDCGHVNEPGCAVLAAVERGEISAERLDHAHKLGRELKSQKSRHDAHQRHSARLQSRTLSVALRDVVRRKNRDG